MSIEIIRKKQAHQPVAAGAEKPSAPKNVALRRSIASGTGKAGTAAKPAPSAKPARAKKKAAGQKEMLLPIAGSGMGRAKEAAKPAARQKAG